MSGERDRWEDLVGIRAAIEAQAKLRGMLPDVLVDAAIAALREKESAVMARLEGAGVIVQGAGAIAGGAGSVVVGGNIHGNIQVTSAATGRGPGVDPAALRSSYLNRIVQQAGTLSLAGIDPSAASEAEALLSLEAVYTGLRVTTYWRPSALEALDQESLLVLLGDPGSGKSTFVNFVALCMAGELIGHPKANLELLRSPLPDEKAEEGKVRVQPWSHGALLPVKVILRDYAARGLSTSGELVTAVDLWAFIEKTLVEAGIRDYAPFLYKELQEVGGLLLLDGYDEVPDAERHREKIRKTVEDFVQSFPKCRVLLTSRTYAYKSQGWRVHRFSEEVLAPFSDGQIERFVSRWYAHAAATGKIGAEDAAGKAELLRRAIFASSRLRELAERPLLLTLMASLHSWRGGSLPEKREQLYADAVELLLNLWESQRVIRDGQGRTVLIQPSLAQYLAVGKEQVRDVLEELAFEVHIKQGEFAGPADMDEAMLVHRLMKLRRNPETNPAELVDYLSQRAGLLIQRGVGVYSFPHRTFQEYLAACHLTDEDFPQSLAVLGRKDPSRWREVVLLAGAKAARGSGSVVWQLADHLCFREPDDPLSNLEDAWGAHLAGQALMESADLSKAGDANLQKIERLRRWHVHLLRSGQLPARERALAGKTLAWLGDPRFNPDLWFLPRDPLLGFLKVPAGPFRMGGEEADEKEHEVTLPAFYIARFPVTIAQYRTFAEQSGYTVDPRSIKGIVNHPAPYISLGDGWAYCCWLEKRLQKLAKERPGNAVDVAFWDGLAAGQLTLTLPSEAEWEKASRGTDSSRIYSWGDEANAEQANYDEANLHEPSTVGCFFGGASPFGCEEMCGNVWEWTRSLLMDYPYNPADGREWLEAPSDFARVVRGGAYGEHYLGVRCIARGRFNPTKRRKDLGFRVLLLPRKFQAIR